MKKEEILGSKAVYISEHEITGIKKDILDSMDLYAKQECILFIKHLSMSAYDFSADVPIEDDEEAEAFYNEFIKSK